MLNLKEKPDDIAIVKFAFLIVSQMLCLFAILTMISGYTIHNLNDLKFNAGNWGTATHLIF